MDAAWERQQRRKSWNCGVRRPLNVSSSSKVTGNPV